METLFNNQCWSSDYFHPTPLRSLSPGVYELYSAPTCPNVHKLFNQPSERGYYRAHELKPGLRNLYVSVKEQDETLEIGVWHLLPFTRLNTLVTEETYDFEGDLRNTSDGVLLYFHGTGEDRSSSLAKYRVFRKFFHVITFDYRSYGDSSKFPLSEKSVVNDCIQLYEWLVGQTSSPILLWGHSLGTALAAHTASKLINYNNIRQPIGLILEAPFTKMSEEIKVHPYGKIFAWLPWFKATVSTPLEKNGFIFDTSTYIQNLTYPIMVLNSEDDAVVPAYFGQKIYEIAKNRVSNAKAFFYQFPYFFKYNHNYLYQNTFLPYFISNFWYLCVNGTKYIDESGMT